MGICIVTGNTKDEIKDEIRKMLDDGWLRKGLVRYERNNAGMERWSQTMEQPITLGNSQSLAKK